MPLSHVSRTVPDGGNPLPLTRIVEPGAPDEGNSLRIGPDAADDGWLRGTRSEPMTTNMVRTLMPTSRLLCCRRGVAGASSTHLVPSQNANVLLRSATRLTQGVPWLCGPASRRVCSFVGAMPQTLGTSSGNWSEFCPNPSHDRGSPPWLSGTTRRG